ncbi:MAG TPA: hypothetical protein ENF83_00180 [Candidatus Korarchaeota archaeon]|nr:hypothetical protein [Candidatus Korarchaeota archaeon]
MIPISVQQSEAALLQAERKRILLKRLEDIRGTTRRYRVFGAALVAVGMFLTLLSWIVLGLGTAYLIVGAIGSALVGAGLYFLVVDPRLGEWVTLADEVEEALSAGMTPSELRSAVEGAISRHPDEKVLGEALSRVLSSASDSSLRRELEGVLRKYFGQEV